MLTVEYHNLRDKVPANNRTIMFYVLKGNNELSVDLVAHTGETDYEWYNDNWEKQEYMYAHRDSKNVPGDIRYLADDTVEFEPNMWCRREDPKGEKFTMRMLIHGKPANGLSVLPFRDVESKDDDVEIAWNYAHIVARNIYKATSFGDTFFPVEDCWELLMETNEIEILHLIQKHLVGEVGNQYYQIVLAVKYNNNYFELDCSQHCMWTEDAWTPVTNMQEFEVFRFRCVDKRPVDDTKLTKAEVLASNDITLVSEDPLTINIKGGDEITGDIAERAVELFWNGHIKLLEGRGLLNAKES